MHKKTYVVHQNNKNSPQNAVFISEIPDTETYDNQKKLFDYLQFLFNFYADDYRPQRVNKKLN